MINRETDVRIQTVCLAILTIFAVGVSLFLLRGILVPFTMAAFLTLVLIPIVEFFMKRLHIGRPVALILTMFIGGMMIFGASVVITRSVNDFSDNVGRYEQQFTKLMERAQNALPVEQILSLLSDEEEAPAEPESASPVNPEPEPQPEPTPDIEVEPEAAPGGPDPPIEPIIEKGDSPLDFSALIPKGSIRNMLQLMLDSTRAIISQAILVLLFTAFLLTGSTTNPARRSGGVITEIEVRVQKYIWLKVIISTMTGAVVYMILAVLGIDYALTFGVFTFILNFIPNVGSFIAVALPLPVVMLDPEVSTLVASLAILLPLAVQLTIGNFIEPKVMGNTLGLHAVVVLMSLIFWTMLWGFPGALLAVPMTSIAKIIFERVEVTRPIALVLEGKLDSLDQS